MRIRRWLKFLLWSILGLILVLAVAVAWLLTVPAPLERMMQARVEQALREHYQRDVKLENLHVTLVPVFRAEADNFVLPNAGDPGLPPFITIKHLTAQANTLELLRSPIHLTWLKLDGLVINVPPKGQKPPEQQPQPKKKRRLANFVIDKVDADGTMLYILPKQAGRDPMDFELRKLSLKSAGIGQPMTFRAELTNPKPPGLIHTNGKFGPWNMDDPSETAVSGHYTFDNADLSIFNGIAGILSSIGDYNGQLNNIVVDGTTDTPDFKLDTGATPVHLTTQFHAIVDGTNGNTYLQPVDAKFLNSHVIAKGEVAAKPGEKGKTITLDIDIRDSHVEDMLNLATTQGGSLLTGRMTTQAKLILPPGNETVLNKMSLAGKFQVRDGRFVNKDVQSKLDELSRRGQGKPDDPQVSDVPAEFMGVFRLQNARMRFSQLNFNVPGVMVEMKGNYSLRTEQMNFIGDVRLQARVSQTIGGLRHWAVVPFDPIFKKNGAGTYLPVQVEGSKSHPEIKLDWKKVL